MQKRILGWLQNNRASQKAGKAFRMSALVMAAMAATPAVAAVQLWDTNGATAGSGNSGGNWTDLNWTSNTSGTTATVAWVAGNDATFSAGTDGTGTFTVALVNSDISVRNITVEEGNVTLGTSGSLKLSAAGTWKAADTASLTIDRDIDNNAFTLNLGSNTAGGGNLSVSGAIKGTGALTKLGAGTLVLSGNNTNSGNVNVGLTGNVGGTLQVSGWYPGQRQQHGISFRRHAGPEWHRPANRLLKPWPGKQFHCSDGCASHHRRGRTQIGWDDSL